MIRMRSWGKKRKRKEAQFSGRGIMKEAETAEKWTEKKRRGEVEPSFGHVAAAAVA